MPVARLELSQLSGLVVGVREAGSKVNAAAHEVMAREKPGSWVQRVIVREIENRARTRGAAYWDELFPSFTPEERAKARIRRMLIRATTAGVVTAALATTAELVPLVTKGVTSATMIPLGLFSVGAEMLYTTALQIDLAFDLASIYGVPFAPDDVGAISTMLASALGVQFVREPTRHDKPAAEGETKPWRVLRQMERDDFAGQVGRAMLEQSFVRNAVPVASVIVSAAWNQVVLRRFANQVHGAIRRRLGIVKACRGIDLGNARTARIILDGAWMLATSDGEVNHQEALALATLIDSLSLPDRIAVQDASFADDAEEWFERLGSLDRAYHTLLMSVLALVASASTHLGTPERRFLRRAARALDRELDFNALERFIAQVAEGKVPSYLDRLELAFAR